MKKILNLVNKESSDIGFELSKFPDGQQNIKLWTSDWAYREDSEVTIRSRLNNFQDLELIICATQSLRNLGVKEIHGFFPYFLGCRSDRQFEEGSNNYLKQVICPIINSLNFKSVTVLDPHSHVLEACLNNFKKEDNQGLVNWMLQDIDYWNEDKVRNNIILVSPDAGASHKIYKLAEQIGYKGDIITCSKERDNEGKLTKTEIKLSYNHLGKDFIIIDDVCDGGATFINIAKRLEEDSWIKTPHNKVRLYLIVTHGIFSKGLKELNKYFDGIYCTNSYVDMNNPEFSLKNDGEMYKLKQMNVF